MPVSVQLPGYRPATIGGLVDVANAINNAMTGSAQRSQLEKQARATDLANQQTELQTASAKAQMQQLNAPDSPATKMAKAEGLMMLGQIGKSGLASDPDSQTQMKGLSDVLSDPNTTGMQVNSYFSSSPMVKSFQALQEAQLRGAGAAGRVENSKNLTVLDVGKNFQKEMEPYRQMQEDVAKIKANLNTKDKSGKPLITQQQIGDTNMAISRIFSPNHQSDSTMTKTEYESAPAEFAAAIQRLTANPQDTNSRKLVEHILDQAYHLGNVSNKNAMAHLSDLEEGSRALTGSAKQAANNNLSNFRKRFGVAYPEVGERSAGGAHPQDKQAIEWAKKNPNDPRSAAILKLNGAAVAGER